MFLRLSLNVEAFRIWNSSILQIGTEADKNTFARLHHDQGYLAMLSMY